MLLLHLICCLIYFYFTVEKINDYCLQINSFILHNHHLIIIVVWNNCCFFWAWEVYWVLVFRYFFSFLDFCPLGVCRLVLLLVFLLRIILIGLRIHHLLPRIGIWVVIFLLVKMVQLPRNSIGLMLCLIFLRFLVRNHHLRIHFRSHLHSLLLPPLLVLLLLHVQIFFPLLRLLILLFLNHFHSCILIPGNCCLGEGVLLQRTGNYLIHGRFLIIYFLLHHLHLLFLYLHQKHYYYWFQVFLFVLLVDCLRRILRFRSHRHRLVRRNLFWVFQAFFRVLFSLRRH